MSTPIPNISPSLRPNFPAWQKKAYTMANHYFNLSQYSDDFFTKQLANTSKSNWLGQSVLKSAKNVFNKLSQLDFTLFNRFGSPIKFSTPPTGAMMLIMYIGLLGARAHRAWERSKMENGQRDLRELMDVLRRDVWAITVYIFGLDVLKDLFSKIRQKSAGFKMVDPRGEAYDFLAHDVNARMANSRILAEHFKHGNGKGLLYAANHNGYFGIPKAIQQQHPETAKKLTTLIEKFRGELNALKGLDQTALKGKPGQQLLSKRTVAAMKHLDELDHLRSQFLKNGGSSLGKLGSQWPEYKNFFAHYAKNTRAPLDLLTLVSVFFLIGYGPILFNRLWTNYKFKKKMAEIQAMKQQLAQDKAHAPLYEATQKKSRPATPPPSRVASAPSFKPPQRPLVIPHTYYGVPPQGYTNGWASAYPTNNSWGSLSNYWQAPYQNARY